MNDKLLYLIFLLVIYAFCIGGCTRGVSTDITRSLGSSYVSLTRSSPTPSLLDILNTKYISRTDPGRGLTSIRFPFNSFVLNAESRLILANNVEWMKAHPHAKVYIGGHCDERGSSKYNLALGLLRAKMARNYMLKLGIPPSRILVATYGKSRPLDPKHNEAAWTVNRRAHFVALKPRKSSKLVAIISPVVEQ